ncbi:putative transcriptional regulatory protein C530.05-like protein 3 [Colletotrichum chlorophyti]|uniref:Putative transcriptional regulatory protein C530.05-like protein 3 n=1 Tax=Colletotrichum chlorophyti TaxID=708187 RepID=A0A1Q8S6Q2_9PEZI|nr:putative transcriptional regulatory protein C530.05-like protein 3 [Colletotrichum chlorophyti]
MESAKPKRACDLCYHKKIKCDAKQPLCSGCKLYNSECTYTGPTRATTVKPTHGLISSSIKKIEALEARIEQLESQNRRQATSDEDFILSPQIQNFTVDEGQPCAFGTASSSHTSLSYSTDQDSGVSSQESDTKTLPSLHLILPVIEDYFAKSNQVLPLFNRDVFMKMLRGWYSFSAHRKPDAWAAVNVVLALALRHSYASSIEETQKMQLYINNVQSVLNQLVINEPSMLALQIVLGLVLVFHGSSDSGPASILIATAIRLVQGLRLHTKNPGEELEPTEALQRNRVFWIAYILDRDLSLRTAQPPLHQDSEIDVELPSQTPPDSAGLIFGSAGQVFNYFRSRVQLAHIQGKGYSMLQSVRARKLPQHEKGQNMLRVRTMLENWQQSIPADFLPRAVVGIVSREYLRYLSLLHYTHLQLTATTHYADSHHLEWLQEVLNCSKAQAIAVRAEEFAARLPSCWDKLVTEARMCIHLYAATPENDAALTWLVSCGYLTSIMFITVNNLACPNNPHRLADQSNVDSGLLLLERLIKVTNDTRLKRIYGACKELNEKARDFVLPGSSDNIFGSPGLEFGGEDPLDDGRWELTENAFWSANEFAVTRWCVSDFSVG